ncbi:ferredoxin [Saccharopolyspora sp. NPDC047091]|uniref:ferredoxin n=1 Tax=Saccharopolyspora sp. NPDC047091 TaxID=3155924 RepID=UPI0033D2CD6B
MEIEIDEDKCIGAGQCVLTAESVFDQRDEDGVVVLLDASPGAEHQDAAREAATLCPAAAIAIRAD